MKKLAQMLAKILENIYDKFIASSLSFFRGGIIITPPFYMSIIFLYSVATKKSRRIQIKKKRQTKIIFVGYYIFLGSV